MNKRLRFFSAIFGQLITTCLTLLLGILLIYLKIPGNGGFCDPEVVVYATIWLFFIIISASVIVNAIINYKRKKWMKFRIITIYSTLLFILITLSFRWLIFYFYYGNESFSLISDENNERFIHVNIQLYENGKFFSETYQNCIKENTGTYFINGNKMALKFNDKKPDFLGTQYLIIDNKLNCLDCNNEVKLILKK